MSKTAAKRQAHKESSIYRQGSGWIISTWDDAFGCNTLSNELSTAARPVASLTGGSSVPTSFSRSRLGSWQTQ